MTDDGNAPETTVQAHDYAFTFYPGFCSRAVVRSADGKEVELYKQTKPYKLPNHDKRPATKHFIRLDGGKQNQHVTLHVDDPELRIAKITVELYGKDHDPEAPHDTNPKPVETLEVMEWPKRCPPDCDS